MSGIVVISIKYPPWPPQGAFDLTQVSEYGEAIDCIDKLRSDCDMSEDGQWRHRGNVDINDM